VQRISVLKHNIAVRQLYQRERLAFMIVALLWARTPREVGFARTCARLRSEAA
jgi:hypothetical protein